MKKEYTMKLIGIFGTGRNGSTLLLRVLDGIPGVFTDPAEVNFLSILNDLAEGRHARERTIKNATSRPLRSLHRPIPIRRLVSYYKNHILEIEQESLSRVDPPIQTGPDPISVVSKLKSYSAVEFVPAFIKAVSAWTNPGQEFEYAMFKSIETPYVADYEAAFPEMRFIHIIRDPIDVWSSAKRTITQGSKRPGWYMGFDVLKTMIEYRWMPHAQSILANSKSSRHICVRYEDLINDAEKVITEISNWVGAGMPEKPTTQTILGGRTMTSMGSNPSQKGVIASAEVQADLATKNAYDKVLTNREHDFIRLYTHDLARQLGYEEQTHAKPEKIWRRWLAPDRWDFMHVHGIKSWIMALASFVYRRVFIYRACRSVPKSKSNSFT